MMEQQQQQHREPQQDEIQRLKREKRILSGLLLVVVPLVALLVVLLPSTRELLPSSSDSLLSTQRQRRTQEEPVCACQDDNFTIATNSSTRRTVTLNLVALHARNIFSIVEESARDFEAYRNGKADNDGIDVQIKVSPSITMPAMYNDIINDAKSGGGFFDGYFTNPVILGTVAPLGGFVDLAPQIHSSQQADLDWTDILLPFRKYVAQFEGKIYMLPLDGDIHSMYVRKDVLEYFGLDVPRTWDEYNAVAKAVHGKVYQNITLSGSCVSRVIGSHGQYWSHLILASITQTDGPTTGSMFDTKDMKPLTGEAFVETLRILEQQALYGVVTEFDDLNLHEVHSHHMNDGTCALTYSWGDTYKLHRAQGSVIGPGQLGVYPTPGSTKVLDRKTMKLSPCTKEVCKHGTFYEDIGWVNHAPYLANGGWSGAVSANAEPEKQRLVAEFFLFACAKNQALKGVIPQASTPWSQLNSQDPFRKSQLEVEKWVEQGYDAVSAKEYQVTVLQSTLSKNLAVDMRTPAATEIMGILDQLVHDHLIKIRDAGEFAQEYLDLPHRRNQVTEALTAKWADIIQTYDNRGDTEIPILEVYQRLRDVYIPKESLNQLTGVRPLGLALMIIIMVSSIACVAWVFLNRSTRIVKAAQPFFLDLIAVGAIVMSFSILTMSVDDSMASQTGCNIACMATPWLAATGFTLIFSALFSKIWRLKLIMDNARKFKRVELTIKDVILPLVVLLCLNVVFLSIWTAVDPLVFVRIDTGRTDSGELSSYGKCSPTGGVVATVMLSFILAINLIAVLLANFKAYQTRNLSTDFSESKYIALCMASILEALLIGAPLVVLAGKNPTASFVVQSMLVFVVCMSVLGLMFLPKVLNKGKPPAPMRASHLDSSKTYSNTVQQLRESANQYTNRPSDLSSSLNGSANNQHNNPSRYPEGVKRAPRGMHIASVVDDDSSSPDNLMDPEIADIPIDRPRPRNPSSCATQDFDEFAEEKPGEHDGKYPRGVRRVHSSRVLINSSSGNLFIVDSCSDSDSSRDDMTFNPERVPDDESTPFTETEMTKSAGRSVAPPAPRKSFP
ncbi:acid type B receptor subunit 2 [Seminavis robusta]|uniref:Acid type B receptor subunit 2 n=1 Tax=Seminavis robusta TaxID=568900 RepID=A0A9N8H9H4_9STRA|nr:acid type B receptor subunit 2 [Seminavis robusta]|eukprot:Sro206_g086510.1 acid type B receptor subunit 2 (1069) ;mRNA; r:33129-36452